MQPTKDASLDQSDICASEKIPDEYKREHNQDIFKSQRELADDVEVIGEYGKKHPADFTSAAYRVYPEVGTQGLFVANLDEHEAAIRPLLEHPDQFDVEQAVLSARDAAEVKAELESNPTYAPHYSLSYGTVDGHLEIGLAATRKGRDIAKAIHERWGRAVCVAIAGHPYPKGAWPDDTVCHGSSSALPKSPDVDFTLAPEKTTVARGEIGTGVARITNNGSVVIEAKRASAGIGARPVADGVDGRILGRSSTLAMPGDVRVEPGQTVEVSFEFGTDDCRPDADFAIPAGTYELQSSIEGVGASDGVTITVVE